MRDIFYDLCEKFSSSVFGNPFPWIILFLFAIFFRKMIKKYC